MWLILANQHYKHITILRPDSRTITTLAVLRLLACFRAPTYLTLRSHSCDEWWREDTMASIPLWSCCGPVTPGSPDLGRLPARRPSAGHPTQTSRLRRCCPTGPRVSGPRRGCYFSSMQRQTPFCYSTIGLSVWTKQQGINAAFSNFKPPGHLLWSTRADHADEIPERDVTYHFTCLLIYHLLTTELRHTCSVVP